MVRDTVGVGKTGFTEERRKRSCGALRGAPAPGNRGDPRGRDRDRDRARRRPIARPAVKTLRVLGLLARTEQGIHERARPTGAP